MTKIAIIGAGICGLRAMLELAEAGHSVTIFEKSKGVGGRVATRRFDHQFINHGIENLYPFPRLEDDVFYQNLKPHFSRGLRATDLPKAMVALGPQSEIILERKVINLEELQGFDSVIVTQPIPQVIELLGPIKELEGILYSPKILFIGLEQGTPVRLELTEDASREFFDLPDEIIRKKASDILRRQLESLDLKKWRFSQVANGSDYPFLKHNHIYIAGDAFDPHQTYDLAASWISGREAAKDIVRLS